MLLLWETWQVVDIADGISKELHTSIEGKTGMGWEKIDADALRYLRGGENSR